MSMYCDIETQFKDRNSLVAALKDTGQWELRQIEIHEIATNLYGYKGDQRKDLAHIIIRRKNVGHLSNDIGFRMGTDGKYKAIISEFDKKKYNSEWIGRLKQNYVYRLLQTRCKGFRRKVTREKLPNGHHRISVIQE